MWDTVVFVDWPLNVVEPWEMERWGIRGQFTPRVEYWRMTIVAREAGASPTDNLWGHRASRAAWAELGRSFRSVMAELGGFGTVYLCDDDPPPDAANGDSQGVDALARILTEPGHLKILARRMPSELFVGCQWPLPGWMSGAALIFPGSEMCRYRILLDGAIRRGEATRTGRLMAGVRFDLGLLSDLMADAALYASVDSWAGTGTADPWFFLPAAADTEWALEVLRAELSRAGCRVRLTRGLGDIRMWREGGIVPPSCVTI